MLRKLSELPVEIKPNMRGGQGAGRQQPYFMPQEFSTQLNAFTIVTLDPGVSVGLHRHEGSEEIYWILEGRGLARDDEAQVEMNVGDALLCQDGHQHAIENPGPGVLKMLAVMANK